MEKNRIIGLDLIRSCAILFVIAGHFWLNTPFKNTIFEEESMFVQSIFRMFFAMGVPLFLLLTGYLNTNKTVSKRYYKGCIRVLVAYLFFSIITILFRKYYLHQELSWLKWILKIFDFSAIPYAWYIEMWIGLFLLTPFLDMMYKAIPTRRQKQILILTLYVMTALPDLFNRYGLHLVPGFWASCFPLTLFFVGSYIHEYKPRVESWKLWFVILLMCSINPVFNVLFVHQHSLIQITGGPEGVFGTVIAIAFFLLFYQTDFKSQVLRKSLTKISLLSLDMYLCCYIFDALVYPYFMDRYFENQSQFGIYFFVIVPILFAGSFVMAWVKDWLFRLLRIG
ncbi:hypothetical protein BARVI_00440 [Barnesiella viscericola DSM 18177]|uniref:Acyltransferase 3 domain-containing protein n=1 Tax=Barnesiella viscericola DSM 18177 TaxID=880074 RepID=W0ELA5_9BACT|nr:acyltransferase [Barnesiella viscericola]AHF11572.1 hypothetical protein BARVI_00440 [Barnesiella viscericola DSM 18177]